MTRVVTPGTLTEETLLDARRHNFLAAWAEVREEGALAWADVSTGDLHVAQVDRPGLGPLLARIAPREVLMLDTAFRGSFAFRTYRRRWRGGNATLACFFRFDIRYEPAVATCSGFSLSMASGRFRAPSYPLWARWQTIWN